MAWAPVIGAFFLGALLAWLYLRSREASLAFQAATTRQQLDQSAADLAKARGELSACERELAALRATLDAERDAAARAQTRLAESFKALSADALRSNNQSFLELARESLAGFQKGAQGDLEKRQQAIDALVKPIRESLDKVDTRIGMIQKENSAVSEQLRLVTIASNALQTETGRLSSALSATRSAGTWGELQLRKVVELAGMSSYCDFVEQEASGALRADMVIRLPAGQHIVVDAKAPNEAYREAAAATDETVRAAKLAAHAAKVRGHVVALGAKAYWVQYQPSPEFVVLFLPGDQFLSAALQADPELMDDAIASKVLLASPATLIALLKAAAYGWRQEAVSKNAEEIARIGRELHDRIATFYEHLEKMQRGLEQANAAYNKAVGSFDSALRPGARKFTELSAGGSKEIPELPLVETTPRPVTRRS